MPKGDARTDHAGPCIRVDLQDGCGGHISVALAPDEARQLEREVAAARLALETGQVLAK